jgi:hypothetical protein
MLWWKEAPSHSPRPEIITLLTRGEGPDPLIFSGGPLIISSNSGSPRRRRKRRRGKKKSYKKKWKTLQDKRRGWLPSVLPR